jgi:hypothetical protein
MSAYTERPRPTRCRAGGPTAQHDTAPGILRDAARQALERPRLHSSDATVRVREAGAPVVGVHRTGPQPT